MIISFRPGFGEVTVDGEVYRNVKADIIEQLMAGCRVLWQQYKAHPFWFQSGIGYVIKGR